MQHDIYYVQMNVKFRNMYDRSSFKLLQVKSPFFGFAHVKIDARLAASIVVRMTSGTAISAKSPQDRMNDRGSG